MVERPVRPRLLAMLSLCAGLGLGSSCARPLAGTVAAATALEATRTRLLDGLWYRPQATDAFVYGTTRLRVEVSPNTDAHVRVGAVEEYSGAVGPQLRASLWLAAHLATQAIGADLTRYRLLVTVGGNLDGPSAGALMAAGFMAALLGTEVRAQVTVTGALTADGAIAPVGGLARKVESAARAGKTILGVPAGQRTDLHDGQVVNLAELGRARGVEVVEVADLHDVYRLLTGEALRHPPPVERSSMQLGALDGARLRLRVQALLARVEQGLAKLAEDQSDWARLEAERTRTARADALRLLERGDVAGAYLNAAQAAATASAGEALAQMSARPSGRTELEPMLEHAQHSLEALERALAAVAAAPAGRALQLVAAYSAAGRARGFFEVARILASGVDDPSLVFHRGPRQTLSGARKRFVPALYLAQAEFAVALARDELAAQSARPALRYRIDVGAARRAASSIVAAASGSVDYINTLLLSAEAEQRDITLTRLRSELGLRQHAYLFAAKLASLAVERQELAAEPASTGGALLRLAEAANAYVEASLVLTEEYLLENAVPAGSGVVQLRRRKLLQTLVARAEEASRVAAAKAQQALGQVPPKAQLFHGAGSELVRGDVDELLRALRYFWRSMMASELSAAVLRPEAVPRLSRR